MPSADDFLQAILANPDDDTPRLVYADWLEERGDPRGEFIRLQCELAQLPDSDPRILPKREREAELVREHHQQWLGPLNNVIVFWRFRRGFVEVVSMDAEMFVTYAEQMFHMTPIRQILFYNAVAQIPALSGLAALGRAPSLDFRLNQIGDHGVVSLVASRHLARVTSLTFAHTWMGDYGAQSIAESRWLTSLIALDLQGNQITEVGANALAQSPQLARLTRINLRQNRINDAGWGALVKRFGPALV
jgi:uncharacterized protein (TIGR02996 family)